MLRRALPYFFCNPMKKAAHPNKYSARMSLIRSTDTKPELIVRRYLYGRGYRYRKNYKRLPGSPDIVLRKYRTVIFVHGCFWHGHETHLSMPKSNVSFWEEKIRRNKERDERAKKRLQDMGWNVITVWECSLTAARRQATLAEIELTLNKMFLEQFKPAPLRYDVVTPQNDVAAEPEQPYGTQCD